MSDELLDVRNLRTTFGTRDGTVHAVDGLDLSVSPGETVCLVGESGSGKTVTCESITRLLAEPPARVEADRLRFDGEDLLDAPESSLREVRGDGIAYVFQNPQNALDPVYTVRAHVVEALRAHRDVGRERARERAVELLAEVGIPNPRERCAEYPHQFSGGMRQRVLIAMALAADPDVLIADEPTTALDVTTEAAILDLFADLAAELDVGVLLVTHDLGVVYEVADRVIVLYGGKVMETGSAASVFENPTHPYTRGLLASLPGRGDEMRPIEGEPPDPADPPSGCRFHPRCPDAVDACRGGDQPPLHELGRAEGRRVSCVYYDDSVNADPASLDGGGATPSADSSSSGTPASAADDAVGGEP
ncbi:ABC transporter ATP-binding protein [Halorarum salinum]|uniref:Nickel import system ATP-binding protein NikD n=1 Tax=Halorarum salinum TaxID=2743089 RepID=A0A7D5LE67_9EURY|nr:ABC transporter ATP-binding protein [Halobaculum salinum]QLG64267.1 ABC transporter ATP-binding protein [Halobaculum salinum]